MIPKWGYVEVTIATRDVGALIVVVGFPDTLATRDRSGARYMSISRADGSRCAAIDRARSRAVSGTCFRQHEIARDEQEAA